MLWQLHWQFRDGADSTDFRAQRDINSNDEMRLFVKEIQESQTLPDNAIWMVCNEKSKHFIGVLDNAIQHEN